MRFFPLLLVCLAASLVPALGAEKDSVPVAASKLSREALAKAAEVFVFEGLPHPTLEQKLRTSESERTDTTKFMGQVFYTPDVKAKAEDTELLKSLLSGSDHLSVFQEEAEPKEFHPDYAVRWKNGTFTTVAMICFDCGEVIYVEAGKKFRYGLTEETLNELKEILDKYQSKRPKSEFLEE
ncbi:hypothetical protein ACFQY0_07935 [Haloferula chungangensis]|uniref:Uncharacterized protein n=1 Tax=Haloferula chungangensis TaxID=1048331 RepID=A0ABW2L5Y1_9BACT